MRVTKCKGRFEVIVNKLEPGEGRRLIEEFQDWLLEREFESYSMPTDEDYMAALGPCGK